MATALTAGFARNPSVRDFSARPASGTHQRWVAGARGEGSGENPSTALGLRTAYLAMHRQTDACLATSGCTAEQFVLLGLLAREDAVTQQELVRRASSDPNTVRAVLVLLEERGLVARVGHPTDGRARSVTLTGKGRRLHRRQLADTEPLRKRLRSLFSPQESKALVEFLARISEALSPTTRRVRARKKR